MDDMFWVAGVETAAALILAGHPMQGMIPDPERPRSGFHPGSRIVQDCERLKTRNLLVDALTFVEMVRDLMELVAAHKES